MFWDVRTLFQSICDVMHGDNKLFHSQTWQKTMNKKQTYEHLLNNSCTDLHLVAGGLNITPSSAGWLY